MRKAIIVTTLTLALTVNAAASEGPRQDRGYRDRDTVVMRVIKIVKRILNISPTEGPSVPIP